MKIIILGAGQVGGTLTEHLADEQNDVTVVDSSDSALRQLQERLDIRTVKGDASKPTTLADAGAQDADMLIAVTDSDEVNMLACAIAYTLYRTPTKICRIREVDYLNEDKKLFQSGAIPVDVSISPERLVTDAIHQLILNPGSLQVLDFAGGKIRLVAVRAVDGGPIVGRELQEIREHMPSVDTRVAAIFRKSQSAIIPEGSTVVEPDDEAFFIAASENIRAVTSELRKLDEPYKRVMIAGGGKIGASLAKRLEQDYQVKVLELNYDRCRQLSEELEESIVLNGSANDSKLLQQENIANTDVFCALTNNGESNIMMSMLAKRLGAKKVITLITNSAYAELVGQEIDIAISPQQITISSLLTHVRKGDISAVHSLRRGAAEALEMTAHGDPKTSKVVGRRLDELDLPPGATVGAILRGDQVIIAHRHVVVEEDDHVILFLTDPSKISLVEKLFVVGGSFI
ncbi:MAG: Trk system potassium transporter TrkA [Luminiphilus sp.]|uniref:Trk system potassium uptake protein TrkA n=1 Tax=Candidatus Paraluminiphilus aquimaris TaxID=2518994 RepID=A0ABY6Q3B1_9GAMM|nr:Trk system potassium transporter TrkA [Candidatus Paraluminiphilus aquimaris]MAJ53627.1 Trk system potassium transporter TrkA [Halieaceae bacterium]MCH1458821.1 Trk system potassium transporter TrkA [Luminiphilus sp.]OUV00627.1 MAG: Trk system potassium transport protein TrkA [Cellvibrionales bacterium TMED79]UZP73729.1 Trk system potassium transporter TrkA [Candidatus Paraluminiphilus aquimaris]